MSTAILLTWLPRHTLSPSFREWPIYARTHLCSASQEVPSSCALVTPARKTSSCCSVRPHTTPLWQQICLRRSSLVGTLRDRKLGRSLLSPFCIITSPLALMYLKVGHCVNTTKLPQKLVAKAKAHLIRLRCVRGAFAMHQRQAFAFNFGLPWHLWQVRVYYLIYSCRLGEFVINAISTPRFGR